MKNKLNNLRKEQHSTGPPLQKSCWEYWEPSDKEATSVCFD